MEKTFDCLISDLEANRMSAEDVINFVVTFITTKHMEKTAQRLARMRREKAISHIYMLAGRECA